MLNPSSPLAVPSHKPQKLLLLRPDGGARVNQERKSVWKQQSMETARSANFEPDWKPQLRRPRRFASACKKQPSPPRRPPTRLSASIRIRPLESRSAWACSSACWRRGDEASKGRSSSVVG